MPPFDTSFCKEPLAEYDNSTMNKLHVNDMAAHRWYRFVLSFPPHLVRHYIELFGIEEGQVVLDPFCGTGTTVVECKKRGISSIGIEALPMGHFASMVKADWTPDPQGLMKHAKIVADKSLSRLEEEGIQDIPLFVEQSMPKYPRRLPSEVEILLPKNSISPLPLHKTLILMEALEDSRNDAYYKHERLALAKALIERISNLRFGPEIGVGKLKSDVPVVNPWLSAVREIADDLAVLPRHNGATAALYRADSRKIAEAIKPISVDAIITSPPYPNEKDYTRTTRLETVLLGFVNDKMELRQLKKLLVRSNTRNVYKDDEDDLWVQNNETIQRLAQAIEAKRLKLGKTSGFERTYHRVTKLYFGGMARHLTSLKEVLRPGAKLAYVVGDQASYLRIMIRTGQLLADIAESLGYQVMDIDLFRTRLATATGEQLREEVIVLHWPGSN
jgi:DNA modification methylase